MGRTKELFEKNKEETENNRDDYLEIMYNENIENCDNRV